MIFYCQFRNAGINLLYPVEYRFCAEVCLEADLEAGQEVLCYSLGSLNGV